MTRDISDDSKIHLIVKANIIVLERSLLDLKKIIQTTDIKRLSQTIRELGLLKESIESLEEATLERKSRE